MQQQCCWLLTDTLTQFFYNKRNHSFLIIFESNKFSCVSSAIQPKPSSISYEIPTTTSRPAPIYSKYVCGVKGNARLGKSLLSIDQIPNTSRHKRNDDFRNELNKISQQKSTERLVLGSSLLPIPIIYHDHDPEIPDAQ
jgi:hypothetical protein